MLDVLHMRTQMLIACSCNAALLMETSLNTQVDVCVTVFQHSYTVCEALGWQAVMLLLLLLPGACLLVCSCRRPNRTCTRLSDHKVHAVASQRPACPAFP